MKKLLITGASGFLGSRIADYCKNKYEDLRFAHLGDCVDYGMRPNETISELRKIPFIVNIKDKYGIYNAKLQKMVVKPLYSSYEIAGNFVIFSNRNATEKYNTYGERIML